MKHDPIVTYAFPPGGLPGQTGEPDASTAIFTESYAVIPAAVMCDIVTSFLPGWVGHRVWILARPMTGFSESFAQYAVELSPGGGSNDPEPDPDAQGVIFVTHGEMRLTLGRDWYDLKAGSYAYLPPSAVWSIWNTGEVPAGFHWVRKRWTPVPGMLPPEAFVTHERDVTRTPMPDCDAVWATQRFADPFDLRHDMHVNIVNIESAGRIPFAETHVMEHGLYVLSGSARYLLNRDWVEVGPGDFMWLRAFCPQACIATGDETFRYMLYKDVNRHVSLSLK